ncbi:protein SIEVE ELEMENT OCCLUSION B-like [Quillaja saponaria]|uniref:Protein SIEVE ELEMENT OCCLUSION B-like n=1 Tax=Quillaja saponaria TaxID=32244 RepID=A0AAD7P8L4_QUISA|nr:protein SIEVE ELEMENT OCCLUSION B-like [Quillaja saponaria]
MASNIVQDPRTQTRQRRSERNRMFATSDDNAMMKQILATHVPDGREVDVKPILNLTEDILQYVTHVGDGEKRTSEVGTLEKTAGLYDLEGMLETLAFIIQKISCELACRCAGGGDAHTTTLVLFNTLSSYPWDAKFEALSKLIKASIDVTKRIIEFKELPSQYISEDTPPMSIAIGNIPVAAYWTIRSIVACASQIVSLIGSRNEYISSTTEAWELSSLAHKVDTIDIHLKQQLIICNEHINEKKYLESFKSLEDLFGTAPHIDNMKIIAKLLRGQNEEQQPLVSDEIVILDQLYRESRMRHENQYEVWYSVYHPLIIEPAVIKYIKEVWNFSKKMILVALDPQGRVSSPNALNMLWIWANLAFPFTQEKEEDMWKTENWSLQLLVDGLDPYIPDWITEGRIICLYGGEDIEWIRKFTQTAKAVAAAAGITLEMVYVGKSNAKERMQKMIATFAVEKFSYFWPNLTSIWFFWARLESMLYSKLKHGKSVENDHILNEVMGLLSFDGSDQSWAIFCRGPNEIIKTKGVTALNTLIEFEKWKADIQQVGFVGAFGGYYKSIQSPHHCTRLILPGSTGGIPERVVCAECGRQMEKYFMYSCCVE